MVLRQRRAHAGYRFRLPHPFHEPPGALRTTGSSGCHYDRMRGCLAAQNPLADSPTRHGRDQPQQQGGGLARPAADHSQRGHRPRPAQRLGAVLSRRGAPQPRRLSSPPFASLVAPAACVIHSSTSINLAARHTQDVRLHTSNLLTWIDENPVQGFFVFQVLYAVGTGAADSARSAAAMATRDNAKWLQA